MPTKIPVNGFGRLGKLSLMATVWPDLLKDERRILTQK